MIDGLGYLILKSGSTLIEIKKAVLIKKELRSKGLIFTSDLDNNIDFFDYPDGLILQFRYHVFKFGGNEALAKYRQILSYNFTKVKLKFYAGNFFKDINGIEADFYLKVKPEFWDTPDKKDVLILTLESLKPIDFSASALPANTDFSHVGDNYYPNVDSQGNIQIYNI